MTDRNSDFPGRRHQATHALVQETQRAMAAGARPAFVASDIEHLNGVVRLTIEFAFFLEEFSSGDRASLDVGYECLSIISGIDSFLSVFGTYNMLRDTEEISVHWFENPAEFQKSFRTKYAAFLDADRFEPKCRYLLELFKMQIVFAGATYVG